MGAGALAGAGEDSGAGGWLDIGWREVALTVFGVLVGLEVLDAFKGLEPEPFAAEVPVAPAEDDDGDVEVEGAPPLVLLPPSPDIGEPELLGEPVPLEPGVD